MDFGIATKKRNAISKLSRNYPLMLRTTIESFKRILEDAGVAVTVRRTLGSDIDAACGQLRAENSRQTE